MTERNLNIRVITDAMPKTVHAFSMQNGPDSFTVVLNAADTESRREAAFIHEMQHIYRRDHEKEATADEIEKVAHG